MSVDFPSEPSSTASATLTVQQLYARHHGWLHQWLQRQLGNRHDAADLAHDTFERLLRQPTQPDLAEPRAYLTVVARRLLIGRARRAALEQAYAEALALQPPAQADSPEQHLQVLQTLEALCDMIDGLPMKCQQVFILAQVQGLDYATISARLGMSRNAVQKALARALAHCYAIVYG